MVGLTGLMKEAEKNTDFKDIHVPDSGASRNNAKEFLDLIIEQNNIPTRTDKGIIRCLPYLEDICVYRGTINGGIKSYPSMPPKELLFKLSVKEGEGYMLRVYHPKTNKINLQNLNTRQ